MWAKRIARLGRRVQHPLILLVHAVEVDGEAGHREVGDRDHHVDGPVEAGPEAVPETSDLLGCLGGDRLLAALSGKARLGKEEHEQDGASGRELHRGEHTPRLPKWIRTTRSET